MTHMKDGISDELPAFACEKHLPLVRRLNLIDEPSESDWEQMAAAEGCLDCVEAVYLATGDVSVLLPHLPQVAPTAPMFRLAHTALAARDDAGIRVGSGFYTLDLTDDTGERRATLEVLATEPTGIEIRQLDGPPLYVRSSGKLVGRGYVELDGAKEVLVMDILNSELSWKE